MGQLNLASGMRGQVSCLHLDQVGWERRGGREGKTKRRSNRWFPARQEVKLLPTERATRGYRFRGVSTNSGR